MRRLSGAGSLGLKAGLGRVCEEDTFRAALRTGTTGAGLNAATVVESSPAGPPRVIAARRWARPA
ncbi:hypothetical protein GCM10010433_64790 [Streptomyces pulveraceus]|uniref:Uncharacterized protein n=1 Tax=Streptomyces pulveraceus TaxID=68258 RepID=A0ABW1GVB4_9ACTN